MGRLFGEGGPSALVNAVACGPSWGGAIETDLVYILAPESPIAAVNFRGYSTENEMTFFLSKRMIRRASR